MIERADLESILLPHKGSGYLSAWLHGADPRLLLTIIGRYIYFNSVFGGGVANLAGEISVRQDLFYDPDEQIRNIRDRSIAVAADIFAAAIDEFGDRTMQNRFTHRALAQATLKGIGRYFDYSSSDIDTIVTPNGKTHEAVERVKEGYLLNQRLDDRKILEGIGFHMSSEILADAEFRIIDSYLHTRHPHLVAYLRKNRIVIGESALSAYAWVQIHTYVEMEHFNSAILGANKALRYYTGPEDKSTAKAWILGGFARFAEIQTDFLEHIAED